MIDNKNEPPFLINMEILQIVQKHTPIFIPDLIQAQFENDKQADNYRKIYNI